MSKRANIFLAAAVASLGLTLTVGAKPVSEQLLNDYIITGMSIAQVDDSGRCVVIVSIKDGANPDKVRAVAATTGDVRVYSDFGATAGIIARAQMVDGASVTYIRKLKESQSSGDPVAKLKALYKSFKNEKAAALKQQTSLGVTIIALTQLGANTAVGTPEAYDYADAVSKQVTVTEWYDFATARVTALALSLVAVGVDPLNVV